MRNDVIEYAKKQYGTVPEQPWPKFPGNVVLRHAENKKWYGIIMNISRDKLGLSGEEFVDVLDVKVDPDMSNMFLMKDGFFPGYHMNKNSWMTLLLDGTVPENEIKLFLDTSYDLTAGKKKQSGKKRITEWIVPANPKYYDIEKAIAESTEDIFLWKQSSSICVGDTVYLYVAAPVSAIRYKCKAVEVDIPCQYQDQNVRMNRAMNLKLLDRYDKKPISFAMLKEHGVYAVRGPRSIPKSLVREIGMMYGGESNE